MTIDIFSKAILVAALGVLLGCSKKPEPAQKIADDPATEIAAPIPVPTETPDLALGSPSQTRLAGIWLDDADPFNSIEFDGNILTARYADEKYATIQEMVLRFVRNCEDQRADAQSEFFTLVTKHSTKPPLCYRLLTVSETKLSYENVTRGTPVTFSRAR